MSCVMRYKKQKTALRHPFAARILSEYLYLSRDVYSITSVHKVASKQTVHAFMINKLFYWNINEPHGKTNVEILFK